MTLSAASIPPFAADERRDFFDKPGIFARSFHFLHDACSFFVAAPFENGYQRKRDLPFAQVGAGGLAGLFGGCIIEDIVLNLKGHPQIKSYLTGHPHLRSSSPPQPWLPRRC